jgi:ribosomal protein S18 acetylase RimI-like enzyme
MSFCSHVRIRHCELADRQAVYDIESQSFVPTAKKLFRNRLTGNLFNRIVASLGSEVIGFAIHHRNNLRILNLAVYPCRRRGIGTLLVEYLIAQIDRNDNKRKKVDVFIRERDMASLLFFRKQKFKTNKFSLRRGFFKDTGEDAVYMEYFFDEENQPLLRAVREEEGRYDSLDH